MKNVFFWLLINLTLFFLLASNTIAATYYTAKTGLDTNPGTEAQPFLTINKGLTTMSSGDTLYVREGTYDEEINNSKLKSGTSWETATTLAAYPGETVIVQPTYPGTGTRRVIDFNGAQVALDQYIIVDGIVFDGVNLNSNVLKISNGAHHIRFQNCVIKNGENSGILISNEAENNEIINCTVFNNGNASGEHGIYLSTNYALLRGNTVYDNSDDGIKVNDDTGSGVYNVIEDNIVYDNLHGIEITNGSYTTVRNNIIFNNNNYGIRGRSVNPTPGNKIINNTSIGNTYGVGIEAGFDDDVQVTNNLFYGNTIGIYVDNTITAGTFSNNLSSGNTTNLSDSGTVTYVNNLIGDSYTAGMSDPNGYDFTLTADSDAVDNGKTDSDVTDDIDGVPRPRGSAYDIGAYERYGNDSSESVSGGSFTISNWQDSTNYNFFASSFSNIVPGSTLTLSQTNRLSNSGFTMGEEGWTRRVGLFGFDPTSVSTLEAWYKADSISGVSNGGVIGTWADSTANSHDATQTGSDTLKPTLETDVVNGYPVVKGNKTNGVYMSISDDVNFTNDFTVHQVSKEEFLGGTTALKQTPFGSSLFFFTYDNSGDRANTFVNSLFLHDLSTNVATGAYNIWSRHLATSTLTMEKDGAIVTDSPSYTVTPGGAYVADTLLARTSSLQHYDGRIAELLLYTTAITSTERDQVDAYLNNKYFLPITSPYSSSSRNIVNVYNDVSSANVSATTYDTDYLSEFTLSDAKKLNLKAYVYNGGSAVNNSVASLYFDEDNADSVVSTTYTSLGSGWYELTGTVDATAGDYKMGVRVEAGQSVYIARVFAQDYATSGTFNSSILDAGTTSSWTNLSYDATTPAGTSVTVKARGGQQSDLSDANAFSSCTVLTSGSDPTDGGCVDLGDRYLQYQVTLTTTDTLVTPTFNSISADFSSYDLSVISPDLLTPKGYTKDASPTLIFRKPADISSISTFSVQLDESKNRQFSTGTFAKSGDGSADYLAIDNNEVKVGYLNEQDSDSTNDKIFVEFKDLANNLLAEGKHIWNVKVRLVSGGENKHEVDFYIDKTAPTLTDVFVDLSGNSLSLTATASDPYVGSSVLNPNGSIDNYEKISSGPHKLTAILKRINGATETTSATDEYIFSNISNFADDKKTASFNYSKSLERGFYSLYLILEDGAGNVYAHQRFGINTFLGLVVEDQQSPLITEIIDDEEIDTQDIDDNFVVDDGDLREIDQLSTDEALQSSLSNNRNLLKIIGASILIISGGYIILRLLRRRH